MESRAPFVEAFNLAHEHGEDFLAVDAAHMMGIVEDAGDQLGWNLTALEMARGSADERAAGWQGYLYNNLGWTYHRASPCTRTH